MVLYCFLILHYNSLEDTENCISSIKKLDSQENIRILVVDNHSPNGSGTVLMNKYRDDPQITILCTEENFGFSRGNNIGCDKAVKEWNPGFLIAANNDIVFPQPDFLGRIREEYQNTDFDVLGPDIYDPNTGNSQSPMSEDPPSAPATLKTIIFNSIALLVPNLVSPLLNKLSTSASNIKLNPHISHENVVLQGSCMIFSGKYLGKKLTACNNCLFYPETQFYYEEYIQTLWCRKNNCKIVYDPSLLVYHMGGRATLSSHINDFNRIKFRMKNIRDSARQYFKFLISK